MLKKSADQMEMQKAINKLQDLLAASQKAEKDAVKAFQSTNTQLFITEREKTEAQDKADVLRRQLEVMRKEYAAEIEKRIKFMDVVIAHKERIMELEDALENQRNCQAGKENRDTDAL